MEIKVLGTGCAKCKTTYQTIEKVISENMSTRAICGIGNDTILRMK